MCSSTVIRLHTNFKISMSEKTLKPIKNQKNGLQFSRFFLFDNVKNKFGLRTTNKSTIYGLGSCHHQYNFSVILSDMFCFKIWINDMLTIKCSLNYIH